MTKVLISKEDAAGEAKISRVEKFLSYSYTPDKSFRATNSKFDLFLLWNSTHIAGDGCTKDVALGNGFLNCNRFSVSR